MLDQYKRRHSFKTTALAYLYDLYNKKRETNISYGDL